MPDAERLVKFNLLGQDFAFYTGASEEEMEAILNLVRQQVDESSNESGKTIPVAKVAVMASLNLASRYVRLKQDFDDYRLGSEARLGILCEKIEHHFIAEK
jgi:cell division protein ZapA (FtsZ GTPase activity inhibitor)